MNQELSIQEFFSKAFTFVSYFMFVGFLNGFIFGFTPATYCFVIIQNVCIMISNLLSGINRYTVSISILIVTLITILCAVIPNRLEQFYNW